MEQPSNLYVINYTSFYLFYNYDEYLDIDLWFIIQFLVSYVIVGWKYSLGVS
jgi:hypothetical protein